MNKQELLSKYAKKYSAKAGGGRPMLAGVHYAADGTAYVTDGHHAIRIRNVHQFEKPWTVDARSGAPITGIYPDVTKVFIAPIGNRITIDSTALKSVLLRAAAALDVAKRLDKKHPVISLVAENGSVYLRIKEEQIYFQAFFGNTEKIEPSTHRLNAEYLHTAISVFADYNCSAIVNLNGPFQPIVISNGEDLDVLILPYRTPQ